MLLKLIYLARSRLSQRSQGINVDYASVSSLTCCPSPAVGALVAEVSTVVVAIAGPVLGDAAAAAALELVVGARADAGHLVTAIATVIVCKTQTLTVSSTHVFTYLVKGEKKGRCPHLSRSATVH